MTRFHFVRPDLWRVFWCVVGIVALFCVAAATGFLIYAIFTSGDDPTPPTGGEWVRLWFYFFLMYGIGLIYLTWQVSVPVILVLGGLLASLRRNRTS